jgi:hypothetical protein
MLRSNVDGNAVARTQLPGKNGFSYALSLNRDSVRNSGFDTNHTSAKTSGGLSPTPTLDPQLGCVQPANSALSKGATLFGCRDPVTLGVAARLSQYCFLLMVKVVQ